MERAITHQIIQTYLEKLDNLLLMANSAGELTLTKVCESLIREMFSTLYKNHCKNVNLFRSNIPSIDLEIPNLNTAIQVTSDKSAAKILETYETFFKRKLHNKYSRLINVVLTNKNYNDILLTANINKILEKYGVSYSFDLKQDLITLKDLYNFICITSDIEQLNAIRFILEQSFEKIQRISNLSPYYQKLKALFFEEVMDDPAGLTLNSIYVEPSFSIDKSIANSNSTELKRIDQENLRSIKDISVHALLNSRFTGSREFDGLFQSPRSNLTFVLGYPGQGKTSLCSKLLFDLLTVPHKKNIFYLKLRNISDTKKLIHNPFNVIYDELETEFDSDFKKSMLKDSITILDGLDELFMKDNLTSDDIESFCKGLIHETEKFPDWQVLVTTRHGYINFDRLYKEAYIAISLMPLDSLRQKEWLSKYTLFHPKTWLSVDELAKLNGERKSEDGYIKELINQPLLLYIVASLKGPLDYEANRASIYNSLFDQIIDRKYSKDGQIENLKMVTKDDLRIMLQEIAYIIFQSGKGYASTKEVLANENIQEFLSKIGNSSLSGTLKGILISFYFKEATSDKNDEEKAGIEFFHKSLQEYLTAERIANAIFDFFLNKDQNQKFIVKKGSDVLQFLNEMFANQVPTMEVWEFIDDLLRNRTKMERADLQERMSSFTTYLFSKDFIYEFKQEQVEPLEISIQTFSAYWHILQTINISQNYINSRIIGMKLLLYLQMLSSQRYNIVEQSISNQQFDDMSVPQLSFFYEEIINATFLDCHFESLNLYDIYLKNNNFFGCEFLKLSMYGIQADKIKFNECEFYDLYIDGKEVKKMTFSECVIEGEFAISEGPKRGTILFKDCFFSEKNYLEIKSINNVKIERSFIRDYLQTKSGLTVTEDIEIEEYVFEAI